MTKLGQLFDSNAKTELLNVLHHHSEALHLRALARLADVHPHSAERVLAQLTERKIVVRVSASNRVLFVLRRDHQDVRLLASVFKAVAEQGIRERSKDLAQRARRILGDLEQMKALTASKV